MSNKKPLIMIGIPTCMRPIMLGKCLDSIASIDLPSNAEIILTVADNDKNKTAYKVVQAFKEIAPFPVKYSSCIDRGLSNVRNNLLKQAIKLNANYILCIDDDCTVSNDWVINSYDAILKHSADAVGPGNNASPNPLLATESIIMSAKIYKDLGIRYNPSFNFTGGEDSDFARQAIKAGAKFCGDPHIKVYPQLEDEHREGWEIYIKHHYARCVASCYVKRVNHNKPILFIIFEVIGNFIKGIILIPFAIFSFNHKKRLLKAFIKSIAFARSLFGLSNYKPYEKIAGK